MNPFLLLCAIILPVGLLFTDIATAAEDLRSFQHGIKLVALPGGNDVLVWSSSGNPPTGAWPDGSWPHDVYYSFINPANPVITPVTLISKPEAQEPASAAISADGHILITMEDGWNTHNEVAQRYGVYDTNLSPVLAYPQMVFDGGHSGHVAAAGNRFVVFFSNEWVDGGGVDNLGSGDDVLAQIYSSTGRFEKKVNVAVGRATRDWWPVVAGSDTRAALVWQRFVPGQTYADLMFSLLDPATGKLIRKQVKLAQQVKYYTYSVAYLPSVDRFLVLGAYAAGGGFAFLLEPDGNIVATNTALPAIIRESQSIVRNDSGKATLVQPVSPAGVMELSVTADKVALSGTITDDYAWSYIGTDGIFTGTNRVFIASLSRTGLVTKIFIIH